VAGKRTEVCGGCGFNSFRMVCREFEPRNTRIEDAFFLYFVVLILYVSSAFEHEPTEAREVTDGLFGVQTQAYSTTAPRASG
jgi:hypothetical protein